VFEAEPLPEGSPLRESQNTLLTPHVAWYSEDSMPRLQRLAAEEAARALRGEPLRCPIYTN
jgi:D-3-phosphoglycerate dehydrogenase